MATRGRYWCLTEHSHPEALLAALELEGLAQGITYFCGQLERGEETDKLHLQAYVELSAQQRVSWLKSNLTQTGHFEIRRGTQEEAIAYTCKDDTAIKNTWVEYGEPTADRPGKRNDLLDVQAKILDGATYMQIADEHFATTARYGNFFKEYILLKSGKRDSNNAVQVIVLHGPSGTGKSSSAFKQFPDAYEKSSGDDWFTGYAGEKTVIFDEYHAWFKWGQLLKIIDRHPCKVRVHGGLTQLLATCFVFTSNKHPKDWYPRMSSHWPALERRITDFFYIAALGEEPVKYPPPFACPAVYDDIPSNAAGPMIGYPWTQNSFME